MNECNKPGMRFHCSLHARVAKIAYKSFNKNWHQMRASNHAMLHASATRRQFFIVSPATLTGFAGLRTSYHRGIQKCPHRPSAASPQAQFSFGMNFRALELAETCRETIQNFRRHSAKAGSSSPLLETVANIKTVGRGTVTIGT